MVSRQQTGAPVLSSHRASRHVASPSLGHYAPLSFVVIGRGQMTEIILWERLSAAIRTISSIYRLLLTAYFSILC
jgi:hypothetical protein